MNNSNKYGGILVSMGIIGLMYSLLLSESSNITVVIGGLSVFIMLFWNSVYYGKITGEIIKHDNS